jgi:hypothetical protein
MPLLARIGAILLCVAAAYAIGVVIHALVTVEAYDPSLFWPAIGLIVIVAAAAIWFASRLHRRRW